MRLGALSAGGMKSNRPIRGYASGGAVDDDSGIDDILSAGNPAATPSGASLILQAAASPGAAGNASPSGAVNQATAVAPQLFAGSSTSSINGPLTQNSQYQQLRGQLDSANADRLARISNAKNILQAAQNNQTTNLPLLAAAGAFMAPTRTGSFGESMGNAINAALPQVQQQRQSDEQAAKMQAQIDMQYGDVVQQAAKDALSEFGVNFFKEQDQARLAATQAREQAAQLETVRHNKAQEQQNATSTNAQAAYYKALADAQGEGKYDQIVPMEDEDGNPKLDPNGLPLATYIDTDTGDQKVMPYDPSRGGKIKPTDAPDPDQVSTVAKAIANYQTAPLSGFVMKTPYGQAVMALALQINPDYKAGEYKARNDAITRFDTGKQGDKVTSLNVAVQHLDVLQPLITALDNGDVNALNAAKQTFKKEIGSAAPTDFNAMAQFVGNEVVKASMGTAGALGDREEIGRSLSSARSPDQLNSLVNNYKQLMAGQLGGLQTQYESSTKAKDFLDKLKPRTREVLMNINGGEANPTGPQLDTSSTTQTANQPPIVPQLPNGVPPTAKYSPSKKAWYWQDENGQWQTQPHQ